MITLVRIALACAFHRFGVQAISQQEAERRGRVYDVQVRLLVGLLWMREFKSGIRCPWQRLSFLFNLSDVTVVDATRKGNKTKVRLRRPSFGCEV